MWNYRCLKLHGGARLDDQGRAVCFELKWLAWDTFMVKGRYINCRIVAPSDVKKHLVNVTKLRWWQKKKQVSEMEI